LEEKLDKKIKREEKKRRDFISFLRKHKKKKYNLR
jgi:hypothetical protein